MDRVAAAVEVKVGESTQLLERPTIPTREHVTCTCSPKDCPCVELCYPDVPDYSIFHLHGIHTSKARKLLRSGTRHINGLTGNIYWETRLRRFNCKSRRTGLPIVEQAKIREVFSITSVPTVFLRYESWAQRVADVRRYRPYQQMVFQYSLPCHTRSRGSDGTQ